MKMKLFSLILTLGSQLGLLAASQDFSKGIDFTGRSNVTASALNLLVDNATPSTNRGMLIITNGAPSVVNDPKLVRYIWVDTSINPPALKTYNTNSSTWVAAAITAGSVGTAQIADAAVSTVKIANSAVDNSKLADDSVTAAKIVDGTVGTAELGANIITREKLFPALIDAGQLTNSAVQTTNIAANAVTPAKLSVGFLLPIGGLASNSVFNSNLTASVIQNTNIALAAVSNINMAANSINYTNLGTNVTYITPKYILNIDSAGTITQQIIAPGNSACTAARPATGEYTITFGTAMSTTNYVVNVVPIRAASGDGSTAFAQITTNSVTAVTYHIQTAVPGGVSVPAMVTIWGL